MVAAELLCWLLWTFDPTIKQTQDIKHYYVSQKESNQRKLYVLVMSRTRFRVNPHSIIA